MANTNQIFTTRQQMQATDFEFFHYKDAPDMVVDFHNHGFYELYFFLTGKVSYLIEGVTYRLEPGDLLLIHPNNLHRPLIEPGEPYERIVIWIRPEFLHEQSSSYSDLSRCFESARQLRRPLIRPHPETLTNLIHALSELERPYDSSTFGEDLWRRIHFLELLIEINRASQMIGNERRPVEGTSNEKIQCVIQYINDHPEGELSLDALSERFFISKYHLLREFKRHSGYTVHQYIRQKRLILARELLLRGLSVTDVCLQCRFGDYSHFIRAFKAEYGLSPRKYGLLGRHQSVGHLLSEFSRSQNNQK